VTSVLTGLAGLPGTVLRGMRARLLLTCGSMLLTALAIGSAILGPSFQEAVTSSYAITRLDEAPARATGISRVWQPAAPVARQGVASALDTAEQTVGPLDDGPWLAPQAQAESVRFSALRGVVRFWSRPDACDHLEIEGRCPTRPGEVLMLAADAETTGAEVGEPLELAIFEPPAIADQHPRPPFDRVTVVGTYSAPGAAEQGFWYDPTRFASIPERTSIRGGYTPYAPAPMVTAPGTFDDLLAPDQWSVRVDRGLSVTSALTTADLEQARAAVADLPDGPVDLAGGRLVADNDLGDLAAVADEVAQQEETARSSVAPAVLSLVLVALALLLRLLMAASELRVPELALASLRGVSARRLWALGLAEPLAVLLLSIPVGVALGVAMAVGLARWWLLPGLPVPFPVGGFVAGLVVLLAAVGVAVGAVSLVLRETLATQLAGVRRPDRGGRWATLAELLLVALAVAVLVSKLSVQEPGDPDATDLALPVLLAVVAGLGATRLVALLARWWAARSHGRSLSGYVSSRAIARRREGTLVILPITAAVAVSVFGAGVHDAAATWRHSVAATVAPADTVWGSDLPLADTIALTHRLDPAGEHLATVATVAIPGSSYAVADTRRLPAVAAWPSSWSPGRTVAGVVDAVAPVGELPRLDGRRVSLTVDNGAETSGDLVVELRFGQRGGTPLRVYLGPYPVGTSTRTARLPRCGDACLLEGISLAGGAATTMEMEGSLTLSGLAVDGSTVPGALDGAGWVANPDIGDLNAVTGVVATPDALEVRVDSDGVPGLAKLSASGLAEERRVARGAGVSDQTIADIDGSGPPPVDPVVTVEGMPFLGPAGLLIDHTGYTVDRPVYDATFDTRVLARDGLPDDVRRELAAAGLSVQTTLDEQQRILDQGAYALALRLYAVVAVLVLLMALAGLVVSTAVQLPARRRDAAALRVVGVPRRSVMWAVAREFVAVLGGAALAGILAGTLAQWVVLRTITLGYVEDLATPRLVADVDPVRLALLALAAVVVLGAAAYLSAALTVRGARGSTLRESAR